MEAATLEAQIGCALTPVAYLPSYYRLAEDRGIAGTEAYQAGLIYGGDVSSGVAIAALDVQPGDDCLDLCCAPGVKMAAMAELAAPDGSVTGVDIDAARLAACRTLLRKYKAGRVRLYRADGRTFAVEAPPLGTRAKATLAACADRTGTATAPVYASAFLRACPDRSGRGYDRVLVDAECTHDGSTRHLLKAQAHAWAAFVERGLEPARVAVLPDLQLALLERGFALARPGGTVVYATCSLTRTQNEAVVARFLERTPDARLVPSGLANLPPAAYVPWEGGAGAGAEQRAAGGGGSASAEEPHVLRFDEGRTGTSGLFVAKFVRRPGTTRDAGVAVNGAGPAMVAGPA